MRKATTRILSFTLLNGQSDNLTLKGGLGIKDLAARNKIMMMKWLWRYRTEDIGLWKEVIKAKHGSLLTSPQMSQRMHVELVYGKAPVNFGQVLPGTSHLELAMDLTSNFGRHMILRQLWVRNFQVCASLQLNQILP